jgi:hypothetical protein
LLLLFCFAAEAQGPASNLRKKIISTRNTQPLDSLSIIPNTFRIPGIADSNYTIDYVKSILVWRNRPATDSVWVQYRVFPGRLDARVQRFRYDSVMNNFMVSQPFVFNNNGDPGSAPGAFNFGNLNYNGSFGRGISFGNNQDAVVNSNFQLQLNGFLGDSIEVAAAITDNNIPIQPDGNTQQLNEFDRIWLQFKKNGWQLSLGDIDIRQQNSYYLNFYKRLQGIAFQTENKLSPALTNKTLVSGSIAKGKFTRNLLAVEEGNQGPYRLRGANNEFFFIVLPNTERVFMDGELLQRGEDQDYVINYNTAEISFTPKRMVTKDKRIQVEFEYADRNYLNTNFYVSEELSLRNKLKVNIGFFSNSDAKNSPINQRLDEKQKEFLNNVGDSIQQALYPNAIADTFAVGKILYKKVDTTGIGFRDSIYIYSTNPDSAKYNLSFTEVGPGKGDYVPLFNGANGKVYKWIAPVGGIKQGSYEPRTLLVTPKKQQMLSLGIDYNIDANTTLKTELALSNYDINTFSVKDKGDNTGIAGRILLNRMQRLRAGKTNALQLQTELGYEFTEYKFKPLERLRGVEFSRDWGLELTAQPLPANEHIATAGIGVDNKRNHSVKYQFTGYWRGNDFNGLRQSVLHRYEWKGWRWTGQFNLTTVRSTTQRGFFLRPTAGVSKVLKKLKNWQLGGDYALEHTDIQQTITNKQAPQSFSFQTTSIYFRSPEAQPNRYGITYFTRSDRYPIENKLLKGDRSQNINLFLELLKNERLPNKRPTKACWAARNIISASGADC